jgi:hypothetical protein
MKIHEGFSQTLKEPLARREALRRALVCALAAAAFPAVGSEAHSPTVTEREFVLENDYPFFGDEPAATS